MRVPTSQVPTKESHRKLVQKESAGVKKEKAEIKRVGDAERAAGQSERMIQKMEGEIVDQSDVAGSRWRGCAVEPGVVGSTGSIRQGNGGSQSYSSGQAPGAQTDDGSGHMGHPVARSPGPKLGRRIVAKQGWISTKRWRIK
ncbi:uncharacterized protein LOC115255651 [Aedes albopictus]|uniref:Secreted protein n=1 Tax=Aedes albopictus TaxID=7160 RepID=A0ABM1Z487_AEDAL|nr:uncharacterized protein LOC115255651 [Aedes albopictus]